MKNGRRMKGSEERDDVKGEAKDKIFKRLEPSQNRETRTKEAEEMRLSLPEVVATKQSLYSGKDCFVRLAQTP